MSKHSWQYFWRQLVVWEEKKCTITVIFRPGTGATRSGSKGQPVLVATSSWNKTVVCTKLSNSHLTKFMMFMITNIMWRDNDHHVACWRWWLWCICTFFSNPIWPLSLSSNFGTNSCTHTQSVSCVLWNLRFADWSLAMRLEPLNFLFFVLDHLLSFALPRVLCVAPLGNHSPW